MTIRTSITHPLCLDPLPVGTQGGVLGITLCPGKHAPSYNGPAWGRDLELDLDHIRHWGALAARSCTARAGWVEQAPSPPVS